MPRWGTYISIDQLGYRRASVRDVVQLASTINRDAGLIILGMYNLALALASMKDGQEQQTERLNVQSAASQKFHFGETASRNEGQVSAFAPRHQSDFSSWTNADDDQARRKVRARNRRESAGTPRRLRCDRGTWATCQLAHPARPHGV